MTPDEIRLLNPWWEDKTAIQLDRHIRTFEESSLVVYNNFCNLKKNELPHE